jgi:uncharacterized surface protein with fasciclin (FAS1) repeats
MQRGTHVKRLLALLCLGITLSVLASTVLAQESAAVGGAPMSPAKDIIDNAVNSKDHTTLVAAVEAVGLVQILRGSGPFTVFAPTNDAFARLPAGTVDTLLQPENRTALAKVLTYHVVAGRLSSKVIEEMITAGHGRTTFTTVGGDTLTATKQGNEIILTDARGGRSRVTTANVKQSNGVIHVIDRVLLPS